MKLDGKVAIVTGAARGIGKAISVLLAREGARIVGADLDLKAMQQTVAELESAGSTAIAVKTNVADRSEFDKLVNAAVDKFQQVDILINNAGISRHAPLLEINDADWNATMAVDLKGVLNGIQAVAPHMMKRRYGKIVNIASNAGITAFPARAAYGVAKAGVVLLTKAAARELGPYGINVNAIAPGQIMTDLTYERRTQAEVDALVEYSKKAAVIGRVGYPEDVANAVLFLVDDRSNFISAQVIMVDGGRTDYM